MQKRSLVANLALVGTLLAGPVAAHAAPQCVRGNLLNHFDATAKRLTVCDLNEHCDSVDLQSLAVTAVKPAVVVPPAITNAASELCQPSEDGTVRCSVMGKRAKRFVAENPQAKVRIARNGTMAALDGSLWDLKKDKAIRLRPWIKADAGSLEGSEPVVVGFAGDLVVATMAPCAGPCAESRLFTAKGKAISKRSFSGVGAIVPASGDNYFGFGQYGELVRIHAATKQVTLVGAEREREPFEFGEAALVNGAPTLAYIGNTAVVVKTFSPDGATLVRTREVPFCK